MSTVCGYMCMYVCTVCICVLMYVRACCVCVCVCRREISYSFKYIIIHKSLYRMDLNFRGTKLSRFSQFDSLPRKFSPARI